MHWRSDTTPVVTHPRQRSRSRAFSPNETTAAHSGGRSCVRLCRKSTTPEHHNLISWFDRLATLGHCCSQFTLLGCAAGTMASRSALRSLSRARERETAPPSQKRPSQKRQVERTIWCGARLSRFCVCSWPTASSMTQVCLARAVEVEYRETRPRERERERERERAIETAE